jgi:hypothetical protein
MVGSGELLPQLGALSSMYMFGIRHFCLRGQFPPTLISSWRSALILRVNGTLGFADAESSDPCGITGTLPSYRGGYRKEFMLDLSNNLLTGALPLDLLAMAGAIVLKNNQLTGTVPGPGNTTNVFVLDLSDNLLEVSCGNNSNVMHGFIRHVEATVGDLTFGFRV